MENPIITTLTLGYLAKARVLNSQFEIAYTKGRGLNGKSPATSAIGFLDRVDILATICVSTLVLAMMFFLVVEGIQQTAGSAIAIIFFIIVFVGIVLYNIKCMFEEKEEVKYFLCHLNVLSTSLRKYQNSPCDVLKLENKDSLKNVDVHLVELATEILEVQENQLLSFEIGDLNKNFKKTFDAFKCLGLVSDGYDRYFRMAKRNLSSKNEIVE